MERFGAIEYLQLEEDGGRRRWNKGWGHIEFK